MVGALFDFSQWNPRLPLAGLSDNELKKARKLAGNLCGWQKWHLAHRTLELAAPIEEARQAARWVRYHRKRKPMADPVTAPGQTGKDAGRTWIASCSNWAHTRPRRSARGQTASRSANTG